MVTALGGGNQNIVVQTLGQQTLQGGIPQAIQVLPIGSLGNLQVKIMHNIKSIGFNRQFTGLLNW